MLKKDKSPKHFFRGFLTMWASMVIVAIVAQLALLAGVVWVVVTVLRHMGVLQ